MSEKTEQPTDKKLDDAREEGQVPNSRDIPKLAILFVIGEIAFGMEATVRKQFQELIEIALSGIAYPLPTILQPAITSCLYVLLLSFFLLSLVGIVLAVAGTWSQFGVLISTKALTPKLDRLNPIQGVKNIFSTKKLMEIGTNLAKLGILGTVTYLLIHKELPAIVSLAGGTPEDSYFGFVEMLRSIFRTTVVICLCFAAIDFAIQKKQHTKSLMMSMDDIKREFKEMEGDPMVKGKRRQLARELAESGPASETAKADAVVVNPTHFAIAMLYKEEISGVPIVLAKGKDEIAQGMIDTALEHKIPVIRHVWLARALYAMSKPGHSIPSFCFEAVAHVYATIYELEDIEANGTIELEKYGDPPDAR